MVAGDTHSFITEVLVLNPSPQTYWYILWKQFNPNTPPCLPNIFLASRQCSSSSFVNVLSACCVFRQSGVRGEHGGAGWGHRCHTEPNEFHLPTHTGRVTPQCWSTISFHRTSGKDLAAWYGFHSAFHKSCLCMCPQGGNGEPNEE